MRLWSLSTAAAILAALLSVTSLGAIFFQPLVEYLAGPWRFCLLFLFLLLLGARVSQGTGLNLSRDSIMIVNLLLLLFLTFIQLSGILAPGLVVNPFDMDGSLSYNTILPIFLLIAGLLSLKQGIDLHYGYSSKGMQVMAFALISASGVLTTLLLLGIIFTILYKGIWAINWEFLTTPHYRLGQKGGISTCIEGTFWLVMGAMLVSAPLGVGASIYLNEYSHNVTLKRVISVAVGGLNGVPSVVYGLFGLAVLVTMFGISLGAGSIILGLMNLPTIILTSQEALKSVPNSLREGSLALGATRWQTIHRVVLPSAMPGILTGLIIGVARAAGETAPIMWTAVTFTATPVSKIYGVIPDAFQPVNNLCYHLLQLIYFLGAWDVETNAWGTALVLISLVLAINLVAIMVRNYYRKKVSW